jgi:hypothetical protein
LLVFVGLFFFFFFILFYFIFFFFIICLVKGEYDELVLGEALRGVCELVAAQCEQVSENEFLGQHERFALLLDTALRHGQLQHLAGPALALLVSGAPPEPLSIAAIQQQRELEVLFFCFVLLSLFSFAFFSFSLSLAQKRVSVPGHVLAKLEPKSSAKQPKANPKAAERRPVSTVVVKQTPKK